MAVRSSGTPSMYQQGALGVLEGLLMLVTRGGSIAAEGGIGDGEDLLLQGEYVGV